VRISTVKKSDLNQPILCVIVIEMHGVGGDISGGVVGGRSIVDMVVCVKAKARGICRDALAIQIVVHAIPVGIVDIRSVVTDLVICTSSRVVAFGGCHCLPRGERTTHS